MSPICNELRREFQQKLFISVFICPFIIPTVDWKAGLVGSRRGILDPYWFITIWAVGDMSFSVPVCWVGLSHAYSKSGLSSGEVVGLYTTLES
jgi:hypothetical protein